MENLEELKTMLSQVFNKIVFKPEKEYTLYDWLEYWLKTYKIQKLKKNSIRLLRTCIDVHIHVHFKNKPLTQLVNADIMDGLNSIEAPRMRKYVYGMLNNSLQRAYLDNMIECNIMTKIEHPTYNPHKYDPLTPRQQKHFFKIIKGNKLETLYKFYIFSGCRKSEALRIKWSDIDYDNKVIRIRGTKTKKSDRYIPLFDNIQRLLQNIPKTSVYIFPYTESCLCSNFARLRKKYGIRFRIHDLRHTFASNCFASGVSMKTVQKWLGHSSYTLTANTYTHIYIQVEHSEADKVNQNLQQIYNKKSR